MRIILPAGQEGQAAGKSGDIIILTHHPDPPSVQIGISEVGLRYSHVRQAL